MVCPSCGEPLEAAVSHEAELGLARVNLLRIRGDLAEAERHCREVLAGAPASLTGHLLLGEVLLDRGRAREACREFEKALELDPDNEQARRRLSQAERERNAPPSAPSAVSRAWVWGVVAVIVVAIGVAGYLVGANLSQSGTDDGPIVIERPIRLPEGPPPRTTEEDRIFTALRAKHPEIAQAVTGLSIDHEQDMATVTLAAPTPLDREATEDRVKLAALAIHDVGTAPAEMRVRVIGTFEGRQETLMTAWIRVYPREAGLQVLLVNPWWHPVFGEPPTDLPSDQTEGESGSGPAE